MANIFEKSPWGTDEWRIFHHNLDLLRGNMRKQNFSSLLNVGNIYRMDLDQPGDKALAALQLHFRVDKDWLGLPQDTPPVTEEWTEIERRYINMLLSVIRSSHQDVAESLLTNISQFYQMVQDKNRLQSLQAEIDSE